MNKSQRVVWTAYLAVFIAVGGLGFLLWHDHQESDAICCGIVLILASVVAAVLHALSRPRSD